jgi:SecD/SecF fusion protein
MIDFVTSAMIPAFLDLVPADIVRLAGALLAQNDASTGVSYTQWGIVIAVIAVLVIPFVVGGRIAKALRMPTYGTRIGAILFAIIASGLVLTFGKLSWGVDLRGGTIIVYELDPTAMVGRSGDEQSSVRASDVIDALTKRINPSGTQEIQIRPYGDRQVEIIIPAVNPAEVDAVKRQIVEAGILRFAIVANGIDHGSLIETADDLAKRGNRDRKVVDSSGRTLGFWADVDRLDTSDPDDIAPLRVDVVGSIVRDPSTGEFIQLPATVSNGTAEQRQRLVAEYLQQQGIDNLQILMVYNEKLEVTGEDLSYVSQGYDQDGSPSVRFSLRDSGSQLFYALTLNNQPEGGRFRQLGIVLDNRLLSAPTINSPIQGDGTISGNFTTEEVSFLVNILRAGQLPAALNKVPISENQIGSTLGADTISKGLWAIGISMVLVLVFVFFYYRLAGLIACLALVMNVLMILALMILINQPITLPGLAGLVLTVGMSVDANVLIFERIREEIAKGSAPRLAIRNGFSRATTTIVDANLTTLITAIVLYAIGTDQIRGFAVTLILGILFSMFTAIYVSRTLFDVAERHGKMSLGMSDLVSTIRSGLTGNKDIDFMGKGKIAIGLSLVLIVLGVVGIAIRGADILDIDFAGGASVTFQLDQPASADDVRRLVEESLRGPEGSTAPQFTLNRVDVQTAAAGTVYKVDAAFDDDATLKKLITDGFEGSDLASLVTYHVEVQKTADAQPAPNSELAPEAAPAAAPEPETTGAISSEQGVRLVATRAAQEPNESTQENTEPVAVAEEPASQPAAGEIAAPQDSQQDTTVDPSATAPAPGSATETPAENAEEAVNDAGNRVESTERIVSESIVSLSIDGRDEEATIDNQGIVGAVLVAAEQAGVTLEESGVSAVPVGPGSENYKEGSNLSYTSWKLVFDLPAPAADAVLEQLRANLNSDPVWLSSSEISGRVAGQMIQRAVAAMLASLLFIVGYIWFRFQRVAFGVAAVVALVHDVLITVGAIAVSYWLAGALGFLLIDQFKISLTVVAALLTIVGYSLNDTIVVFDRIRETRGKSPRLTTEMINSSINQTLSRTLLTSLTTMIVVVLLYFFGGSGIHAFAFSLVVGVFVGTYSSIFVASPVLLWLVNRDTPAPSTKQPLPVPRA